MPVAHRKKRNAPPAEKRVRNAKFQADLAPAEERALRALKQDLQLRSNTDFLIDAVALFRWAVAERRAGRQIISETKSGERRVLVLPRLERVAPELQLPWVEIEWTERELQSLVELATAPEPAPPTPALIRAMQGLPK
jgi:hypothetical protein